MSLKTFIHVSMTPQNAGVDRQTLFAQAPPYWYNHRGTPPLVVAARGGLELHFHARDLIQAPEVEVF